MASHLVGLKFPAKRWEIDKQVQISACTALQSWGRPCALLPATRGWQHVSHHAKLGAHCSDSTHGAASGEPLWRYLRWLTPVEHGHKAGPGLTQRSPVQQAQRWCIHVATPPPHSCASALAAQRRLTPRWPPERAWHQRPAARRTCAG
jgi:hypothetical protein